jgi:hypothetical protein
MALRAAGRFSERMRMLPQCGAGTLVTLIAGTWAVAYAHRCIGRRSSRGLGRTIKGILRYFSRRELKLPGHLD